MAKTLTNFDGSETYSLMENTDLPTKISDLTNDSGFITNEEIVSLKAAKEIILGTIWLGDAATGFTQTISVDNITSSDSPILSVKLIGTLDEMLLDQEEWNKIIKAETGEGIITFTASQTTTKNLTILVKG